MNNMTKKTLLIAVVGLVLAGCITQEEITLSKHVIEVRSGVYATNVPGDLPLPTSGYDVYVVGEIHGTKEIKQLFLDYLKILHETTGLRNIILEEDQVYERDANEYVSGITNTLHPGLCLRSDVLDSVRTYNETLPDQEKIYVHLADVDSPLSAIHLHLLRIHEEVGGAAPQIHIGSLEEFETWSEEDATDLMDGLTQAASDPSLLNQLETVRASLRFFFSGNTIGTGLASVTRQGFSLREEAITKNIEYIREEVEGSPVLALFGGAHGQKSQSFNYGYAPNVKSWTQHLVEAGVRVYSVMVWGMSGSICWRGGMQGIAEGIGHISFDDGTTLAMLFETVPDYSVIYIDLQLDTTTSLRVEPSSEAVLVSDIFDGMVVFLKVTPMENTCS